MKLSLCFAVVSAFAPAFLLVPAAGQAQDLTPPYVAAPVRNITVKAGTISSAVTLEPVFALTGVSGRVVRFDTVLGKIDVQLRDDVAPLTVANFLAYAGGGAYTSSIVHRSVPGFIWQGGGYVLAGDSLNAIPANAPVQNEFSLSNTRGTIAMAKLGDDPNSATDEWFFNEADNSANLDNQNGGFTVFGSVITNSLDVMDAISAVPVPSPGPLASPFDAIPLINYDAALGVQPANLVLINGVYLVPLLPAVGGGVSLLQVHTTANTNPGLVTPRIWGHVLTLEYAPGATGTARLTVLATDTAGSTARTTFTVTVR